MSSTSTEAIGKFEAQEQNSLSEWFDEAKRKLVLDELQPRPDETVVDIGAGTGKLARHLAESAGIRVVAIETSRSLRALGKMKTHGEDVEWVEGSPEHMPLPDASVDAAILLNLLEFVADPRMAIEEAQRVLRPGGRLVAGVLCVLSSWAALYRYLGAQGVEPWAGAHLWTQDEFARMLGVRDADVRSAVYLAPAAQPPFPEADAAGQRAGNRAAFLLARWVRPE